MPRLLVSTHDTPWLPEGPYEFMLWANQSKLRSGQAGLDLNLEDIRALARVARLGGVLPVWGGQLNIPKGCTVCLDLDWYFEQGWTSEQIAPYYQAFKQESPEIQLTAYNSACYPLADYTASAKLISVADLKRIRQGLQTELWDKYLDFITIRYPLGLGMELQQLSNMRPIVQIARETWNKPVFPWLRGYINGNGLILDALRNVYAQRAMIDSGSAGAALWVSNWDGPELVKSCQKFLRVPTRPPTRPPFGP